MVNPHVLSCYVYILNRHKYMVIDQNYINLFLCRFEIDCKHIWSFIKSINVFFNIYMTAGYILCVLTSVEQEFTI